MPGRILIIDSVATNRIVLKVKLSSAFYQVEQAANAADALAMIAQNPPDLILLGADLPDMSGHQLCRLLRSKETQTHVPVVIVDEKTTRSTRLRALMSGADDVIGKPTDDRLLMARIRSLLRARDAVEELRLRDKAAQVLGFAEPATTYESPAKVSLAVSSPDQGVRWRTMLKAITPYDMAQDPLPDALRNLSKHRVPDAFIIAMDTDAPEEALRFLAEIRARSSTRRSTVLVVADRYDARACVDALDLGANDIMQSGFDAEEVSLRLAGMIHRKKLIDRLHQNVHDGLSAAVTDPLTGLHNRRYALPQLARISRQSQTQGGNFAVMVADLDHFKKINDRFGHAAGDIVLAEIARRMRETLSDADLIARIGGEEFLIVLQRADQDKATRVARQLCETVSGEPVYLQGRDIQIPVTVSIGVAMYDPGPASHAPRTASANELIDEADQALYGAKAHGRNQVTLGKCPPSSARLA